MTYNKIRNSLVGSGLGRETYILSVNSLAIKLPVAIEKKRINFEETAEKEPAHYGTE